MSGDFLALALPGVQKLLPCASGEPSGELARELDIDSACLIKLSGNENPLGAISKVLARG